MANPSQIEAARRRYERLLESGNHFTSAPRTHFDERSGGFVVVHQGHQLHALDAEMQTARFYARRGVWVRLLDETGPEPVADAHHGGPHGDGLEWDYKTARAGGDPKSKAQSGISSGKKPSGNVVIRFEDENVDVSRINRGVNAALQFDQKREQPFVRNIVVLFEREQEYLEERRTPEEFLDGRFFQGYKTYN